MKRKLLSLILCLCLAVSMIPAPVAVAQGTEAPAGELVENITKQAESKDKNIELQPSATPTAAVKTKDNISKKSIDNKTTISMPKKAILGSTQSGNEINADNIQHTLSQAFEELIATGGTGTIYVTAENCGIEQGEAAISIEGQINLVIDDGCAVYGALWVEFLSSGHLTISGEGTFDAEIYCEENNNNISVPTGYDLIKTDDIYTVEKIQEVVELEEEPSAGPTVVTTAQELTDALAAGGDIVLGNNIDLGTEYSTTFATLTNPVNLNMDEFEIRAKYYPSIFTIISQVTIFGEGKIINSVNVPLFTIIPEPGSSLSISGGTFSQNVSAYCAEGYECIKNPDGTYTVQKIAHYVCKIGEQGYETLQAAVEAVQNGQTIELIDNITISGPTTLNNTATYTIDTADKTISGAGPLDIAAGDVTFTGNGTVNSNITIEGNAIFTRGTYTQPIKGYATITGGRFNNISDVTGTNVTGGFFKENVTSHCADGYECVPSGNVDYPYMVQLAKAQAVNVDTGKRYAKLEDAIEEATATQTIKLLDNITGVSSSLTINKEITLDLNGKTISGNASTLISVTANSGTVLISNGKLISNDTGVMSGEVHAIELAGSGLKVSDLTIEVTTTSRDAYGIYYSTGSTDVIVKNCNIKAESPTERAYGVYFKETFTCDATITGTTIYSSTGGNNDYGRCVCVDGSNVKTVVTIGDADYQTAPCRFQAFHNNKATATLNTNVSGDRTVGLPFKVYSGYFNYDVSKYLVIDKDGNRVSVQRITSDTTYPYVVEKAETKYQAEIIGPDSVSKGKFENLTAAVGALVRNQYSSGYTIKILMDITNDFTVNIPHYDGIYDYTIDINGFTYRYTGGKTAFSFAGSGGDAVNATAVTIKNGVVYMDSNTQVGFANEGDVTLSDVYLYKIGYNDNPEWPAFQNSKNGIITIHGGNYHGTIVNQGISAKVEIDSGYFQTDVSDYLLSSAYECVKSDAYSAQGYGYEVKPKTTGEDAAEVNGTKYPTLAAAITAASDGAEIKLLRDIVASSSLDITKNLTIDLNGFTVSSSGNPDQLLNVQQNSKLTVKGASGTLTNPNGDYAINIESGSVSIEGGASANALKSAVNGNGNLTIDTNGTIGVLHFNGPATVEKGAFQSTVNFGGNAVVNGGSFAGIVVFNKEATVSGGQFTGSVDFAGSNNANISGGTFSYAVTLETTGTVNITGGRFRHELKANNGTVNVSGENTVIASGIVNGSTVTIDGGTFTGDLNAAAGEVTINKGDFKQVNNVEVKSGAKAYINGGSFTAKTFNPEEGAILAITGGDFDQDVSSYILSTYECNKHRDGRFYVSLKTDKVARIGEAEYSTLQEALEAVNNGETIQVIKNITVNSTDPDNATIRINNGRQFTIDFGEAVIVTAEGRNIEISNASDVTFKNGELIAFIETKDSAKLTVESGYFHRSTETTSSDTVFAGDNITVKGGYFPGNPFVGGTVSPGTDCNAHMLDEQPYLKYYKYIVTNKADDVAQIGAQTYYSIKEAITAANNGNTIILLKNINENKTININKSVTLNLNNQKISSTAGIAVVVDAGQNVAIEDGYIETTSTALERIIDNKGTLKIENVNVEFNDADGTGYISGILNESGATIEMNGGNINFNVPTKRSARPFNNSGEARIKDVNINITASEIGEEVDGVANFGNIELDSVNINESCSGGGITCGIYTVAAVAVKDSNIEINRTGAGASWGIYKTANAGISIKNTEIDVVASDRNNSVAVVDIVNEGDAVIENSVLRGVSNGSVIGLNLQSNPTIEISGTTIVADSENTDSACINAKYAELTINDGHYYASQTGSSSATKATVFVFGDRNGRVFGGFFTQDVSQYLGGPEYSCERCTEPITVCGKEYTLTYKVELNAVAKIVKPDGTSTAYKYFNNVQETNENQQTITVPGALDAVVSGDTIVVLKDYTAGGNLPLLTAKNNAEYTFNLNGHKIIGKTETETSRGVLSIEKGRILIVDNITGDASGEPFGQIVNTNTDPTESAVYVTGDATLEIPDGCFGTSFDADTADSIKVDNTTGTLKGTISAYGGFYSHEVKQEYIKEGFECVPNHEASRLTLGEVPYKWRIQPTAGDNVVIEEELNKLYPTLQQAFDEVVNGNHLRLLKDIDTVSKLTNKQGLTTATLSSNKNVYLKLDNFTIKQPSASALISVGDTYTSAKLSIIGPGLIENTGEVESSGAIIVSGAVGNPAELEIIDPEHQVVVTDLKGAAIINGLNGTHPFPGIVTISGGKYREEMAEELACSDSKYDIYGGFYTVNLDNITQYHNPDGTSYVRVDYECLPIVNYEVVEYAGGPIYSPDEFAEGYRYKVVPLIEARILDAGNELERGTLSTMLDHAVSGQTVQLLRYCDYREKSSININRNITLDLNGFVLRTKSFTTVANVIDSVQTGEHITGLLTSNGRFIFMPYNTQLPMYDNKTDAQGYRFLAYSAARYNPVEKMERVEKVDPDNDIKTLKYKFAVRFTNDDGYRLLAQGGTKVKIYIGVDWGAGEKKFDMETATTDALKEYGKLCVNVIGADPPIYNSMFVRFWNYQQTLAGKTTVYRLYVDAAEDIPMKMTKTFDYVVQSAD